MYNFSLAKRFISLISVVLLCLSALPAYAKGNSDGDGDGSILVGRTVNIGGVSVTVQCAVTLDPPNVDCDVDVDIGKIGFEKECEDGEDNDGDGLTDMDDPGCDSPQDNDESDGTSQCQDTVDNDSDGLVDADDPGCDSPQDNNEGDGTSQCQDGVDNDEDGATDFPGDFSCDSLQDDDESSPLTQCQDGLDNDDDGFTDADDPECDSSQDNEEGLVAGSRYQGSVFGNGSAGGDIIERALRRMRSLRQ